MTHAAAHDYKAQQAARAVAAKAIQAANPHLVAIGDKVDGLQAAAKNIRIELARAFAGVRFSVKSRRFAGGDAIDVRWTDGPTSEQVEEITTRYQAGRFDGMTDSYDYSRSAWREAFGDAKYVHAHRDLSDAHLAACIRTVSTQWGIENPPSAQEWRKGFSGWDNPQWPSGYCSAINREQARRTWSIARRAA